MPTRRGRMMVDGLHFISHILFHGGAQELAETALKAMRTIATEFRMPVRAC